MDHEGSTWGDFWSVASGSRHSLLLIRNGCVGWGWGYHSCQPAPALPPPPSKRPVPRGQTRRQSVFASSPQLWEAEVIVPIALLKKLRVRWLESLANKCPRQDAKAGLFSPNLLSSHHPIFFAQLRLRDQWRKNQSPALDPLRLAFTELLWRWNRTRTELMCFVMSHLFFPRFQSPGSIYLDTQVLNRGVR